MPGVLLEVNNLQRSVAGHAILTDLNFQVRGGEVLFIRGASGVGKSLLLRALAYLDPIEVQTGQTCCHWPRLRAYAL